eukprot:comp15673_c0_seq1/m.12827 comp15673_c0_seq1/g.12827  ORF comp15673_c0_seq1/g.12827 comp15673_c0_seq1/m.12827 type:complete len:409 (-) comp15673_c0_seq1:338-1564(-)
MTTDTEKQEPKKRTKAAASSGDDVEEPENNPKRARKGGFKEKFRDFMLRRIVKENHNGAITKICFNTVHGQCGNIVATVGASQANIYDNENQCNRYEGAQAEGQHIDLMLQWPGTPDVQASMCCWVRDELGDSLLAVGGDDGSVLVLSVARTSAVADLKGHTGEILDMVGSAARDGLLATVGKGEGCVRVWHVDGSGQGCCVATCSLPGATNLSLSPNGTTLLVGCKDGKVHSVAIPETTPKKTPQELEPTSLGKHHNSPIDGIRYVSNGLVVSKSKDGHTVLWDPTRSGKDAIVKTITNARKMSSSDWCSFDVSGDGQHLCVGNSQGEVLVYALGTGDLVARLKDSKLKKMQITACAFSPAADQVLCATEKGYIFRYDYISPEIRAVWDTLKLPEEEQGGNSSGGED